MRPANLLVGCAGWNVPGSDRAAFAALGSHLERYASRFPAVEINSSFYKPHRPSTYARWADTVPAQFRFCVKTPRSITHEHRLVEIRDDLDVFLSAVAELRSHLGCLLVQLPPSLKFEQQTAAAFFRNVRSRTEVAVVCEPRHPTWFTPLADSLLIDVGISRAAVDPAPVAQAAQPGGADHLVYYRMHGSPRMYYSNYSLDQLDALAARLTEASGAARQVWCIFDNTAAGAATPNALHLLRRLHPVPASASLQ